MFSPSRRLFLGASVAGLASCRLFGDEPKVDAKKDPPTNPKAVPEDAAFQPATLFLTWHTDPTTTMDVQWVGVRGDSVDTTVYYAPAALGLIAPAGRARPDRPRPRLAVPEDGHPPVSGKRLHRLPV
jgi:hypothetical protein